MKWHWISRVAVHGAAWMTLVSPAGATERPVAHWALDGTTAGERLMESYGRTALNATETGAAAFWATRTGFGDVLANGGGTNYLTVSGAGAANFGAGSFTLSLWSRRTSDDATNTAALLDALSAAAGSGWQWFYQANDSLRLRLDDDAGNSVLVDTTGTHLNLNSWQHLAVTVDRAANRARIYVNGTEATAAGGVDISSLTSTITPDQALWIGSLNGTGPARGQLDDIAFFDRALTATEIIALNAGGGTTVLALWPRTVAPVLTANRESGFVQTGDTVALSATPVEAVIRYTLDGTLPTVDSPTYSTPIPLSQSTTVQARAFSSAENSSALLRRDYVIRPTTAPNLLVIVGDNIGTSDLQSYGGPGLIATPHLDGIGYDGIRFTQFTTAGPGDLESQYALLTGRVAARTRLGATVAAGAPGWNAEEWTLAELLRKKGYETGFIGNWYLGGEAGSHPNDQGFRLFYGSTAGAGATAPLQQNRQPISPEPGDTQLLDNLTQRAEQFITTSTGKPFALFFQPPPLPATGTSPAGNYGNRVEAFDAAVGRLLAKLDAQGVAQNTLVVFLSDEGASRVSSGTPTGSNGPLKDGAGTTWEGGVRAPFLVRWPSAIPAAQTSIAPLWLPDLFPTLRDLVQGHQPTPRTLDGTSRADVLFGQRQAASGSELLLTYRTTGGIRSLATVRKGPWKLHLSYLNTDPENTTSATAPLLYQVEEDVGERINRASEQTTVLSELQGIATARNATLPAAGTDDLPAAKTPVNGAIETSMLVPPQPSGIRYVFERPSDSLDDDYAVEHSADLANWLRLPIGAFTDSAVILTSETERLTLTVPWSTPQLGGPTRFVRLKAIRPGQP